MLTIGSQLSPKLQREVLNAYVYRNTAENRRARPDLYAAGGLMESCTVPPVTDQEWLASHAFNVTRNGTLDARKRHAEPAWMAA
jgi:hypothetical protein